MKMRSGITSYLTGLVLALGISFFLIPGVIRSRSQRHTVECQWNVQYIDHCIYEWARKNGRKEKDPVTWDDLIKAGYLDEIPTCPSASSPESYLITSVGKDVMCRVNPNHYPYGCCIITDENYTPPTPPIPKIAKTRAWRQLHKAEELKRRRTILMLAAAGALSLALMVILWRREAKRDALIDRIEDGPPE